MGCGASTHVRERLDWISQLEAEIQDLKAQRSEALQRITVTESEKENIAIQSLRNRTQAGQARKVAVVAEQHAVVDKAYLEAQFARAKANEEEVLRELRDLKTEHQLLKLEFSSARLQHTAHVKHLERDIQILNKEKVSSVKTLTSNYEIILNEQLQALREFKQEIIDFLENIVGLADGLKVKQIKMDSTVDIERRKEELAAFNAIPLASYVKEAKEFLRLDPLLAPIADGLDEREMTFEEREAERVAEAERLQEEEERRALEQEKVQRDREERARVRALAEEAPKLQKQVIKLEDQLKDFKATNDELRVQLVRQNAAMLKGGGGGAKAVEEAVAVHETKAVEDIQRTGSTQSHQLIAPPKLDERADMDAADVDLRLDRAFEDISDPAERDKFTQLFIDDVARALGIPRDMIQVNGFESGSIVVKFSILPPRLAQADDDEDGDAVVQETPMELARRLERMLQQDASPLKRGIVTGTAMGVTSRPSSRASSAQSSARGDGSPERGGYRSAHAHASAEKKDKPIGLREELRRAREARKLRDGPSEEEQAAMRLREIEERAARKLAAEMEAERKEKEGKARIAAARAEKFRLEEERRKKRLQDDTEKLMREAEEVSGALGDLTLSKEPQSYWWEAHQNYKLNEHMEVASESVGEPNRHVRVYVHTTFKEFIEERGKLARHVYPELMHLCTERGVAFAPVDLFWQALNLEEATAPEQLHYALDEIDRCDYYLFWFGGCYGWVPPQKQLAKECAERQWLSEFKGTAGYDMSVGEMLLERAVLSQIEQAKGKAFFYFRNETYGDGFDEAIKPFFLDADEEALEKLHGLKEKMRQTHMQVLEDYTEPMNSVRQAYEDLDECIHRDFPVPTSKQGMDTLRERHVHTAFARSRHANYVAAEEWVHRVHAHLDTRAHVAHPLVIVSPPGGGKSAFVSNYCRNYRHFLPQALWCQYYVGCCSESTNYQRIACSIMQSIRDRFGIEEEVPKRLKPHEWQKELLIWLGMASTRGRMVLFLDGLDQVDDAHDNAIDLQWLPRSFPAEVRTIITCSPGPALDSMLERGWPVLELEELDIEARAEMVERYISLNSYPSVDPIVKSDVLQLPLSGSPNYLLQLIDEICVLVKTGRAESVADYVLFLQANDIGGFYDYVLWKWEKFFDSIHPNFTRRITSLIWASRWGLSEQELLTLLADLPRLEVLHFFDLTKYCWHWSDGLVNFSHNTLRDAVVNRYLPTKLEKIGVHRMLGGYFRSLPLGRRRLDEEGWHWMMGESWLELLTTCNNFAYFPRLYDTNDGTYHCDLRRFYTMVNQHLDAAHGLLQGIKRFQETKPEPATFFSIAQMLADFFADVGRPKESAEMYRKMLSQPEDVLNSSFAMRMRIAGLRVSMAKLLRVRWDRGERDFSLLNEGRANLESAMKTYEELTVAAEEANDIASNDRDLPEAEKRLAARVLADTRILYADVLGLIGRLCLAQGDYEAGEDFLMQGLRAFETYAHANHPSVGVITQGLAELHYQKRTYDKAEAMARRTVMVRHLCYGWNHPQFAYALVTLANILGAIGNDFEAELMMRRQAKILSMYPDMEAVVQEDPGRTVQEDLEGANAWQGNGGTHGGGPSNLTTSISHRRDGVQPEPWPKRDDEEEEEEAEEATMKR
eukprot:CAMPEP_0206213816 /NCGR_PEP_ID=MMETSP0047_2-20121206/1322_1 /ASSEMBLY_ACC=CAM_ASM_000192 /TAXON_ID=195065 /ORGANISM="Chroomonas mesostigmatica_cf, Strain CCMP1168" /LENGTH=1638 /DNA_ID=CAMNT_0053635987 /DNA_START=66 /DNA_END=4982 /DNA_ORIENTATION=+